MVEMACLEMMVYLGCQVMLEDQESREPGGIQDFQDCKGLKVER